MKLYLVQNRKCFLHRVRRNVYKNDMVLRVSLFPNITPFTEWPSSSSMDDDAQQQFMAIKTAVETLWWNPAQVKGEVSKDVCLHVTIESSRVLVAIHGRIIDHLYSVCGEGGTIKLVVTRLPDVTNGIVSAPPDSFTLFSTREMELTLAQVDSETLPSPFALSDCKGLGLARCIDESVEIEGYLLNQWGNVSLAGAYGLGVTVHIIFTTKNPKTSGVKSINVDKKIFEQQIHSDLEIKANNGAIIKCHKCFLAAHSPVLAAMLDSDLQESKTNQIEMVDMSEQGVQAFLEYLYKSEKSLAEQNPQVALELLEAAHKYDIPHLEGNMKHLFLEKSNDWFNVDVALHLFLFARNICDYEHLKIKCVQVLKGKKEEMIASDLYKQLFKSDPSAGMELCSVSFFV